MVIVSNPVTVSHDARQKRPPEKDRYFLCLSRQRGETESIADQ